MSIASMTGFAREAGVTGAYQWAWELKTVNGRGLEVRVRTPSGLDAVGEEARGQILKALTRGQGQLNLSLSRASSAPKLRVNQDVLQSLLSALGDLKLPDNVKPASLDGLLAVRGVVELEDDAADPAQDEALVAALKAGVGALIEALKAARLKEGQALSGVLGQQLDVISRFVDEAEASPARQPDAIRARLEAQIAELARRQVRSRPGAPASGGGPHRSPRRYPRGARPAARPCGFGAGLAAGGRTGRPAPRFPGAGIRARGEYPVRKGE